MKNSYRQKWLLPWALFLPVMISSCSKGTFIPPDEMSTHSLAKATVINYTQTETFFNDCCGEDMTLTYTVHLVENGNGFQVSLNQLTGYGHTSGNAYHGANHQGLSFHENNQTFVFTTTLTSNGCVFSIRIVFHVTYDADGNIMVVKESITEECHGNS
jgi:hypothetical protein